MWALLLAAVILYIPANMLPIMHISSLRGESAHTILGGIINLWEAGSVDVALIVFVASLVVPLIKLVGLATLAVAMQWGNHAYLRQWTRLYEMLEFIGQWSMVNARPLCGDIACCLNAFSRLDRNSRRDGRGSIWPRRHSHDVGHDELRPAPCLGRQAAIGYSVTVAAQKGTSAPRTPGPSRINRNLGTI